MNTRHFLSRVAGFSVVLLVTPFVCALPALGRPSPDEPRLSLPAEQTIAALPEGVIHGIEFQGLRRVPAATLRGQLSTRVGEPLDLARVANDVRALERFGWFDSVRVVVEEMPGLGSTLRLRLRVMFFLEESPFLAGMEFRGSRVLSRERIDTLLREKGVALKQAAPISRSEVWRAARVLEAALTGLGHPQRCVRVRLETVPEAAVRAVFDIQDGPRITVGRVSFTGNRAFSEQELRRQMKRIAPESPLAGLRRRNIHTAERLEEDLARVTRFYRDHGYPEVQVGLPKLQLREESVWRLRPWPSRQKQTRYSISISVQEGSLYRWAQVDIHSDFAGEIPGLDSAERAVRQRLKPGAPFSQQDLDDAREKLARLSVHEARNNTGWGLSVEGRPEFDPANGLARVTFRVRESPRYVVRRIEFVGTRRFSERYYRRRIRLREGEPFNPGKLEQGLEQLARAGFIRPARKEDLRVRLDEAKGVADVTIRVEELGRQRFSLVGGHSLGNTLGVAYNLFDLFGGEELITAHLEGGPESLQVLLGLAKEGIFGTRASLGLSLFRQVIRPHLPGTSGRQRLFTSADTGFGATWTYALTPRDSVALGYQLSQATTQYNLTLPANLTGFSGNGLRASTSSRSLGVTASHEGQRNRFVVAGSTSGGWLGGSENLLRSSLEYARFVPDPLTGQRNTWAVRSYLAGVSSDQGELPFYARLFAGDELVRGFRNGELGPHAAVNCSDVSGTSVFCAQPAGANLVGAVNAEYRIPVKPRTELVAFFDSGSGWLLPGWLGSSRPALLPGTNGALRASTGLELRWRVPVVEQTLRVHYAVNPFRLARALALPDGSRFLPPDRRTALEWALGTLF